MLKLISEDNLIILLRSKIIIDLGILNHLVKHNSWKIRNEVACQPNLTNELKDILLYYKYFIVVETLLHRFPEYRTNIEQISYLKKY